MPTPTNPTPEEFQILGRILYRALSGDYLNADGFFSIDAGFLTMDAQFPIDALEADVIQRWLG